MYACSLQLTSLVQSCRNLEEGTDAALFEVIPGYSQLAKEDRSGERDFPTRSVATLLSVTRSAVSYSTAAAKPRVPNPYPRLTIARILNRVRETRLPDRLDASDWRYGMNWDYMKSLVEYWKAQFDWQRTEAILNHHPQFLVRVNDFDVHFYYVKSRHQNSQPLILTHGWPGSVFEFLEVIDPLSDPTRFGGSADEAFDVVVPSIPGFGFSSKPKFPIGPPTVARIWHKLMTEVLGYSKFGAQGGDWGSAITVALAQQFPGSLTGIHLNAAAVSDPPQGSEMTNDEHVWPL